MTDGPDADKIRKALEDAGVKDFIIAICFQKGGHETIRAASSHMATAHKIELLELLLADLGKVREGEPAKDRMFG